MRHSFTADITIDSGTGRIWIRAFESRGSAHHTVVILSPPTRASDSMVAVKNDMPVDEKFTTARSLARFIIQTFMPGRKVIKEALRGHGEG
jgi:hypothetical protein